MCIKPSNVLHVSNSPLRVLKKDGSKQSLPSVNVRKSVSSTRQEKREGIPTQRHFKVGAQDRRPQKEQRFARQQGRGVQSHVPEGPGRASNAKRQL